MKKVISRKDAKEQRRKGKYNEKNDFTRRRGGQSREGKYSEESDFSQKRKEK